MVFNTSHCVPMPSVWKVKSSKMLLRWQNSPTPPKLPKQCIRLLLLLPILPNHRLMNLGTMPLPLEALATNRPFLTLPKHQHQVKKRTTNPFSLL